MKGHLTSILDIRIMVQGTKINEITVGGVTVSVWTATDPPKSHHNDFNVEIGKPGEDDDWVCVGGGGAGSIETSFLSHSTGIIHFKGNYLTGSFPSNDFKSWNVCSRDHQDTYAIELVGYAIGMKIQGLNKEDLRPNLKLFESEGPSLNHPKHSCSVEDGYLLLGGGFHVLDQPEGGGNMATGSFPDSTISWRAHAKDHDISSPSRIKVFAIGIRPTIMKGTSPFGDVTTTYHSFENEPGYETNVSVNPLTGYALCGGGAKSHYVIGRLLYYLVPTTKNGINPNPPIIESDQQFMGESHYHGGYVDLGTGTAYAMGIKFKPAISGSGPGPQCDREIKITEAKSSGNLNPQLPENYVFDGKLETRWISTNMSNPWISVLLQDQKPVCRVDIAWSDGDGRTYKFYIQVSPDITGEQTWTPVLASGQSASNTTFQSFAVTPTLAKRVKVTVTESTPGPAPVQISEIRVFSNV